MTTLQYDILIIGGGPAGLSAALVLGRARRRVLVCDAGSPRNAPSHAMHGFISRDGIDPAEFLRIIREQLQPYAVEVRETLVIDARVIEGGFEITLENGARATARKLLLATGIKDRVPSVEGFEQFYGRSIFHCPYCDGWEQRDRPIAVYGRGKHGLLFSLTLRGWSSDLVLCTDGPARLRAVELQKLTRHGITLCQKRVARFEGADRQLARIVFVDGSVLERQALFFTLGWSQRSDLAAKLGCVLNHTEGVRSDKHGETCVPGLYAAGDTTRDVQLVIVAAAEGAQTAFAINCALRDEDLK